MVENPVFLSNKCTAIFGLMVIFGHVFIYLFSHMILIYSLLVSAFQFGPSDPTSKNRIDNPIFSSQVKNCKVKNAQIIIYFWNVAYIFQNIFLHSTRHLNLKQLGETRGGGGSHNASVWRHTWKTSICFFKKLPSQKYWMKGKVIAWQK